MRYLWLSIGLSILSGCSGPSISHRETYINAKSFFPGGRNPLLPETSRQSKELNLNFNTDFFRYFYWDNRIWSVTDQSQFKLVGWNYKLGSHLTDMIDVQYEHFSKHRLEDHWGPQGFPVEDSIGLNLFLYRRDRSNPGIF